MLAAPSSAAAVVVSMVLTVFGLLLVSFLIGLGTNVVREVMTVSHLRSPGLAGHTVIVHVNSSTALLEELVRYYQKLIPEGSLSRRWVRQLVDNARRVVFRAALECGGRAWRGAAELPAQAGADAHRVPLGPGIASGLHGARRRGPGAAGGGAGGPRGAEPQRRDDPRAAHDPRRAAAGRAQASVTAVAAVGGARRCHARGGGRRTGTTRRCRSGCSSRRSSTSATCRRRGRRSIAARAGRRAGRGRRICGPS